MPKKKFMAYENRLDVGDLSTSDGSLELLSLEIMEDRCCITPYQNAWFVVKATKDARQIECDAPVTFFKRGVGEEEWGRSFFYGSVASPHPLREKPHMRITAHGHLARLAHRGARHDNYAGSLKDVLTEWAERHAFEYYDILDIDVNPPILFPEEIEVNSYSLDLMKVIRRFAPIYISLYLDGGGRRILSMRDEAHPDHLGDLKDYDLECRTYKAGRESHLTAEIYPKREGYWRGLTVLGEHSEQRGNPSDLFVGVGTSQGDLKAYTQRAWDSISTPRRAGWIRPVDIEQRADRAPYRTPNDVLRLEDNKKGTGGDYAVQAVRWTQMRKANKRDGWNPASLTMVLTDRIYPYYIPQAMPGGPDATADPDSPYADPLADRMRDVLNPPEPDGLIW